MSRGSGGPGGVQFQSPTDSSETTITDNGAERRRSRDSAGGARRRTTQARSTLRATHVSARGGGADLNRSPSFSPSVASPAMERTPSEIKKDNTPKHVLVCRKIVDQKHFVALTTILTLYALFGDNIRVMTTEKATDHVFDSLTIFSMAVFLFEVVIASFGKEDYFLGFFFVLDVVSTLSLVMDLSWVSIVIFCRTQDEDDSGGSAIRASRASRAGTRAGRVVRVIRLIRIVKLYKAMQDAKAKKRREALRAARGKDDEDFFDEDEDEADSPDHAESRVGKKLSDMTTRRVIILVLAMLFVLPYLEANPSDTMPLSSAYGVDQVHRSFVRYYDPYSVNNNATDPKVAKDWKTYKQEVLTFLYYHIRERSFYMRAFWVGFGGERRREMGQAAAIDPGFFSDWEGRMKSVLDSKLGDIPSDARNAMTKPWNTDCERRVGTSLITDDGVSCPEDLRCQEVELVSPTLIDGDLKSGVFIAQFDKRPLSREEALLDTIKILFICVVLGAGSAMFNKDANDLVVNPLEAMIAKVNKIRNNPLIAMKLGDDEFKREEIEKQKRKERAMKQKWKAVKGGASIKEALISTTKHEPMETMILEKTIIKLGTLLALGFGEAGSKIIEQNMRGGDSATVNAMVPGQRVDCVLSFLSIRDFAIVNEVLQTHVMTYVNQIAEITHGLADEYHGAANRSNGDAFLLVWRATDDMLDDEVSKLAEMAMIAVIRILSSINKSYVLYDYRGHPGLMQRVPDYKVQVGISLHFGWTIEGAIGSEFKIDASYLSPNVNVTMRLQESTEIYGVNLLMSATVMSLMSVEMLQTCRVIDFVVIPGNQEPMEILTCDLDPTPLKMESALKTENLVWNARRRFKARQVRQVMKSEKWNRDVDMYDTFVRSDDIKIMRQRFTVRFFQIFGMAYHNYVAGEWGVTMGMLSQTRMMLHNQDGPSVALMTFIASHKEWRPPEGWAGYRDLPQKESPAVREQLLDSIGM